MEFINNNKLADKTLIEFLENKDYAKKDLSNYQQYLKDSGQATSSFTILTKKAGSVIKGFGASLASIGVNIAIGMLFDTATTAFDNWIHRVEKARERTAELLEEFSEMRKTHSDQKETVDNYADRYDELSKGVDLTNNKNLSLSTEEYKEFLNINKQLSDTFPTLKKDIDDNGNAILTLGTNGVTAKEQLQDLLDTEENLNNFKISQGLGEAFEGIYTYIEEANQAADKLNKINNKTDVQMGVLPDYIENGIILKKDNYNLFRGNIADETKTDYAYKMQSAAWQFLDGLDDNRRIELENKGLDASGLFTMVTDDLTGNFDFYANLYTLTPDEISSLERLISENVTELNYTLMDEFSAQKTELEEQVQTGKYAWADFLPNLVAGMKSKQTFKNLDTDLQDNIVQIVGNMDYTSANEMQKYNPDPYVYIRDNIIGPLNELSDTAEFSKAKSKLNSLLQLDKDDLTENNQAAISSLLDELSEILGKDSVEIRAVFGYDMSDDQDIYDKSLHNAKNNLKGSGFNGFFPSIDEKKVDDFWSENVKTLDDVALWNKVTEGITNATDAINAYETAKNQSHTKQTFSEAWSSIGTSGNFETDKTATEAKEKLLELAEAGKLTTKELSTSPLADYFIEAGISSIPSILRETTINFIQTRMHCKSKTYTPTTQYTLLCTKYTTNNAVTFIPGKAAVMFRKCFL